jgi:hypothetical protein
MAKKQTFTVGSKDNMRSRLQGLYEFDMAQTKPLNISSLEETPK